MTRIEFIYNGPDGPEDYSFDTSVEGDLDIACLEAIEAIRQGRPGRAEYALTRAGMKAAKVLDPLVPAVVPNTLSSTIEALERVLAVSDDLKDMSKEASRRRSHAQATAYRRAAAMINDAAQGPS